MDGQMTSAEMLGRKIEAEFGEISSTGTRPDGCDI